MTRASSGSYAFTAPESWARARSVVELVPEVAPVEVVRPLRRGRSHVSWVLKSARGWLVGKVLLGSLGAAGRARLVEHRRVWQYGVAVPRVVAFAESCGSVAGRPLTVFEFLPGVDAEEALPTLSLAAVLEVMRATGAALARLHQVPVEGSVMLRAVWVRCRRRGTPS